MGFWSRISQNLSLKIVSLVAAVLLYVFVQQERNPTMPKTLLVNVEFIKKQDGYQVVPETQSVKVTVAGPRPIIERLKDGDIRATADVSGVNTNQPNSSVRILYALPKGIQDVSLADAPEFTQVQVFRQKSRKIGVEPVWKHESPAGEQYSAPIVRPSQVTVRGREDYVNRIEKVIASASPIEPGANIDGDFTLVARDIDNNLIEGVEIVPDKVHITIRQIPLPTEQNILIQASLADRPAAPYTIVDTIYTPNQVKVIGTPQRVAAVRGIDTETLSVHDLTATTTMDATLMIPPDVQVRDLRGRQIKRVKVTFVIAKTRTDPPPPTVGGTPAPVTPKRDGGPGQ